MGDSLAIYYTSMLATVILSSSLLRIKKTDVNGNEKILKNIFISFCVAIAIILVLSFRENIAIDYRTYKLQFTRYANTPWSNVWTDINSREILNIIFTKIFFVVFGDIKGVFAAYAICTWVLFFLALKNYVSDVNVAVATVVLLGLFYAESFNTIRQMLAVAIIAYCFKFIQERKMVPFLIGVVIAFGFHNTAIIALPLYFLCNGGYKNSSSILRKRLIATALIVFPFLLPNLVNILSRVSTFAYYLDEYGIQRAGLSSTIFLKIPIWLLVLFYYRRLKDKSPFASSLYFVILMEILCYIGGMWFKWYTRFSYYYMFGEVLLCGYITKNEENPLIKPTWMVGLLISIYYLILFYIEYYIWGWSGIFPYETFLG